jgi:hypothetical protein
MQLKSGDFVEVRSREEILATLDDDGSIDNLPFMPEMLQHCGKKLRVRSSAHKTCDVAFKTGGRRMRNAVHLEDVRCDGSAHGGCEAGCLIFWKHEWLKRPGEPVAPPTHGSRWDDAKLAATTQSPGAAAAPVYRCQATTLFEATEALSPWNFKQYLQDWRTGNASLGRLLRGASFAAFQQLIRLGIGYRFLVGLYNRFQDLRGGNHYPIATGRIPKSSPTPLDILDLQPGDTVRVKSHEEILDTLNTSNKNRGMWFDAEMVGYCGRTFQVQKRVNKIIDESTGKMIDMKSPCIILGGVYCRSNFSGGRMFCPRSIYSYWRESWLERVPDTQNENLP